MVQIATTDLLMEGQYAGKMAAKPQTGSMMVRRIPPKPKQHPS
jgi:hypothetical protein